VKLSYFFLIAIFQVFLSCEKTDSVDEISYEVTLLNAPTWNGVYFNENAQVIGITDAPNNWKYTFKNHNNLIVVSLTAYADGLNANADAVMKIYVNGRVVASGKSSIWPQVQYQFP